MHIQALENANQAKSISSESSVKVRDAIAAVNDILLSLNNLATIGKSRNKSKPMTQTNFFPQYQRDNDERIRKMRACNGHESNKMIFAFPIQSCTADSQ